VRTAFRNVLALVLAAVPAACGPPAVSSDRDETIPIPQGASWAWALPDTTNRWARDPALGNEITHQRYVRAIAATMEARGFRQVSDPSAADFLLTYHAGGRHGAPGSHGAVMVGFSVGGWGMPYHGGYRYGWDWPGWGWGFYGPPIYGYGPYVGYGSVPYQAGAVFVLLRQRESGNVAWQVSYALDPYETQRVTEAQVKEIVNRLFADLR
jgi:hypothetical protein